MNNRKRDTLEDLRQQLEKLEIIASNIRTSIDNLADEERRRSTEAATDRAVNALNNRPLRVIDRNECIIEIGSRVEFLTRGKYSSSNGVVTRFSRNGERVFSKDSEGHEIVRAPHNLRVLSSN